ncbi:MAG: NAD(P)-dependent oxidoreductase [Methyloprofundus sp.]|nr:NAD(P)-dependent oxidoreductase [Methyloprofundus sp.]
MSILVTGGRGFIGKRLVEALVKKGYQVDILSRSEVDSLTLKECTASFIKFDLLDPVFDFDNIVKKYDVIFNCAGELLNESLMHSLHVEATARLIDACKKIAHKQKRTIHWVQLSSVGAYGASQPNANIERVVTEETIPAPVGEYELTKTLADEIIVKAADEFFSYSILRPSNVYGAEMPNNSIRQLAVMIKKGLFFYIGKPGAISNYVHVDDVVDALILCGFEPRAKGQIFNLSNDCDQSVVINALAAAQSVSPPTIRLNESFVRIIAFVFSWLPKFPLKKSRIDALVSRTHYDTSKIERVLEFKPSRDVKKTIVEVLK